MAFGDEMTAWSSRMDVSIHSFVRSFVRLENPFQGGPLFRFSLRDDERRMKCGFNLKRPRERVALHGMECTCTANYGSR